MAAFFQDDRFLNLRIDVVDLLHPFAKAFFALRPDGAMTQISARDLGSGIEIILTLLLLRSIAAASKGGIVYLIDEPELHLHPSAQKKLATLLLEESARIQILVSTHSPYLIKDLMTPAIRKIILKRDKSGTVRVNDASAPVGNLFPWSPSWGEVNYNAYGMATLEFHNELYGWLQSKFSLFTESDVEQHLLTKGVARSKMWVREKHGVAEPAYESTLCTYVRNVIHHPENRHNLPFSEDELVKSIEDLIAAVK